MNNYDIFYRRYGVRKSSQVLSPPLFPYMDFDFPKESFFHYVGDGPLDIGPNPKEPIFKNVAGNTYIMPVFEAGDSKGNPRHLPVVPETEAKKFLNSNRFFKKLLSVETAMRDERCLVVCNYGQMPLFYTYPRSLYSFYNEWWNKQAAVWDKINELSKTTNRQHFIFMKLPKTLPSLGQFKTAAAGITQSTVNVFDSAASLSLLELWKWIGVNRADSIINKLDDKAISKVNLVFNESGMWFTVNLGILNSWRKATDAELEANPKANKKGVDAETFGRVIIKVAMHMIELRSSELKKDKVVKTTSQPVVNTTGKDSPVADKPTIKPSVITTPTVDETTEGDTVDTIDLKDFNSDHLDEELNALEIVTATITQKEEETTVEEEKPYSIEKGVIDKCNAMAESGAISAAQYRNYQIAATSYKTIPAPDGKGTLEDFIKIKPEDTQIPDDKITITGTSKVIDKTMLQTSLKYFDSAYIKNVMQKDVANMVMGMQNNGIAVTSYDVEKIEDVTGSFNHYTVKLSPVEGSNSTIHFRLPVLNEDGSYLANGTKYRMRKQRGEVPIRKINQGEVALSSYYGKVFVSRSDRRVNNHALWLTNQIMAKGLDDKDLSVTSLYPADVFDNTFKAPRMYTTLANRFRAFTISEIENGKPIEAYTLNFDHSKRTELYTEALVKRLETDGMILFGVNHTGSIHLLMDKNDVVYKFDDKAGLIEYGYLEECLKLDTEKAPVDNVELRTMGKNIAVGLILGHEIGLDKLMKLLGVVPRRVEAGKRTNMQPHEYGLVFADETLIFSKYDKKASLVLSGFNNYHNAIREYNSYEFDKPAVYLNILESVGLGVRYLREIDLMYKMFIDPITRELLVEMDEPTTFRGLLLRSCELLTTDDHPDAFDSDFMRLKGYERMAGAVYSELIRSIRAHAGRVGKNKLPLDFNPHAVWKNISQDPSISLVSDINPIENLKQMEAVTYSGTGGRNSRSMTKHTRAYHRNDMGTISESTVDSGDVGINIFTSANPMFKSMRGLSKKYVIGESGATSLLSTSALMAPGSDGDD